MAKTEKKPNKVYESLKEDILFMKIKPGEAIGEVEIANKFGVSRTPVRDAIRRLESDGLVEVKSHIGTYVTLIDLDQIADVIYMREKIEKCIIIDLIENVRQKGCLKIFSNIEKQRELLESDLEPEELAVKFMILDNEFHKLLFELTGRIGIWEYLQNIQHHYDRFRIFVDQGDKVKLTKLFNEHRMLAKYMRDNDLEKIDEIFENHLYYGISNGTELVLKNKNYFTIFNEGDHK